MTIRYSRQPAAGTRPGTGAKPRTAGHRARIPAATEAALWALSNGRCYAPGCTSPVVVEVRPGVYRKNAQIAHIRGVRAPRHDPSLTPRECAAFGNLLILCLPHHGEVDDKKTGGKLYPVELLTRWKTAHEGSNGPALAALGPVDEDTLAELLLGAFTPPVERLQQIADQLEETGTLNAGTVAQLRQVVDVLASTPAGPSARTAAMLAHAADVFSTRAFQNAAASLSQAADVMPFYDRTLKTRVAQMQQAADIITATEDHLRRYGPR
jgi:hypothetical protein